ncbi:hypothetical protein AVEN_180819-1, partial [Araneus ventricosus]
MRKCVCLFVTHSRQNYQTDLDENWQSCSLEPRNGDWVACKYDKGDWSDCEASTNTRVRTDSLKPKSDSSCEPTRTLSKKCKKVCKYNKQGAWSECDSATGRKTKVLVLKSGSPQTCEANKKITKPCHKGSNHKNSGKGRQ